MTTHWTIDLGTPNTTICEYRSGRPDILNLPDLEKIEPVTQAPAMPSCVCVMDQDGEEVLIAQEAVIYDWDGQATGFARGFQALPRHRERPAHAAHGWEGLHCS